MKRIDKVEQALQQIWQNKSQEVLLNGGSSAREIADQLMITRSNASGDLNLLVREERVIKIKQYPVRYLPLMVVEKTLEMTLPRPLVYKSLTDLLSSPEQGNGVIKPIDPLTDIIGSQQSLKNAIFQAKAAVHYPPFGLHMLLLGRTGSGKTFFVQKIYDYALYAHRLKPDAPFISFNCAEYANNPQLLLSQLFGYKKGAFTGADQDQAGLVDQAQNGILFLDEVHRLPPEGQEMLFYLIDHGVFNRLGESSFQNHAEVLIICATTEDPESSLLNTFVRRIPMVIKIPSLDQRSLSEQVDLTKFLFCDEADRIQRPLKVDIEVINALLQSVETSNVGQLRSLIQLTCAHTFLNNMNDDGYLHVKMRDLPQNVQLKWGSGTEMMAGTKKLTDYLDMVTVITPQEQMAPKKQFNDANIYRLISNKVSELRQEDISDSEINQYIMTDLRLHIRNFVTKSEVDYSLLNFMEPKVLAFIKKLRKYAEKQLRRTFDRRFDYYVGMHVDAFFKRKSDVETIIPGDLDVLERENQKEFQVAIGFKQLFSEEFGINLSEIEVAYLIMLLLSIESLSDRSKKKVGVLVVAHGDSTATSMVSVAKELLGVVPMLPLNMPLTVSPEEIYERIAQKLAVLDEGLGVLMLVDMGSLAMLDERLIESTGIKIKTISNVTTSMVLDAARKINYMNVGLNEVYESILNDFQGLAQATNGDADKPKAILSICTTGAGTAEKIAGMINHLISETTDEYIKVLQISSLKMAQHVRDLKQHFNIIGSVGTKDPRLGVPFIPLEDLIDGTGENALRSLIASRQFKIKRQPDKHYMVRELTEDTLKQYLLYLNPTVITPVLIDWLDTVQTAMKITLSNTAQLKVLVHTAFAFERVLKNEPLHYTDTLSEEIDTLSELIIKTIKPIERQLNLELCQDELLFITEAINDVC
ncbi:MULTISPECIES: sigma-54-dependent transcriptional regulator [Latilactobacillus]|uniref:Sigma-54-dependent transcriptional regulator n=2 Tax=Latilactobacillus curvatus TaxID=28038 RepID=A0A1B2A496_LATCU|nr:MULTISPECIES: sigma-54-dependent transcriptional regulator [Latilactobacillus]ANY12849.1 PTS sugar transporter subunit IIA [Latilactobacillus curvatus]AWV73617.1 sigma-54-dependent transcriptional regulator [Latilactobacillus curvatus]AXN36576.1 sigma-54-dependent transcriptional regulator [Latilactobacillus curvatus]KRK92589.1 ntrc family transcriptional regulator [Latilactobacillus curvatus JCM 1096 = DSM 20019]MCM0725773.1 sigma 54-interacting transcriptional regulator [Latilactobacillus